MQAAVGGEDVAHCRPLVVGPRWPYWHCASTAGPSVCMAWHVALANMRALPVPASVPVSLLGRCMWIFTGILYLPLNRQANSLVGQTGHGSKVMLPETDSF